MAIKHYKADSDNTITNAYKANLTSRGTGSNMGQSDIVEVFSIYGQEASGSSEISRILVKFPISEITTDRTNEDIPVSGSVNFFLRLYNAKHSQTVPSNFSLIVSAVARSWDEGIGLDMENYRDLGSSNWISASISASHGVDLVGWAVSGGWATAGGDYMMDASSSFTASFSTGFEDLELDISPLVEQWVNSSGNELTSATATITVSATDVANIGEGDTIELVTAGGATVTLSIEGQTEAAATATITVSATDVANIGEGDTIKLISTDEQTVTLTLGSQSATTTAAETSGDTLTAKTLSPGSYASAALHATALADEIMRAINYHTKFSATKSSNVITVTQVDSGADGNTTITITELFATGLSKTNFTGGSNGSTTSSETSGTALTAKTLSPGSYASAALHATALADEIMRAINYHTKFSATKSSNVITVTQVDLGADGNTAITITELGATGLSKTDFTGGAGLGSKSNYGVGIMLSQSQETGSTSYYTKKFFARGSQFFFKRPIIEARWDSSKKDSRGSFFLSSSLAPAADNLNTLYLYNYVRGQLKNIPGVGSTGSILVGLYSGSAANSAPSGSNLLLSVGGNVTLAADLHATGGFVSTGIYSASIAFTGSTSLTKVFDVWSSGSFANADINQYHTGTISLNSFVSSDINPNKNYASKITNLKPVYMPTETARFRLFAREKDWNPTMYTKAVAAAETKIIEDVYYKVYRVEDNTIAVDYGTGSLNHSRLSYDVSGSYFDLDISLLETNSTYEVKFIYYENGKYTEQPETFKFRVE